jgi:dCMP deaminase
MEDPRPSWDEYFMGITELVAQRSTCLRRKVGAVAVRDKRILTTGYNGAPSDMKHCLELGCLREQRNIPSGQRHELCRALHAEQNVIIQAAYHGLSIAGSTIYSTTLPCVICAKMLINSGGPADRLSGRLRRSAESGDAGRGRGGPGEVRTKGRG